jgi:hypothetical protein
MYKYDCCNNMQTMHSSYVTDLLDVLVAFSSDICVDFPGKTQEYFRAIAKFKHYTCLYSVMPG